MSQFLTLEFDEVLDRLTEPCPTLILLHRNPDADAVGSAFALRHVLEALGAPAFCVCQDEIPRRLRFLTEGVQSSMLPESIPEEIAFERVIAVDVASPQQLGTLWESLGNRISLMIDHHENGEVFADHFIQPEAAATGEILFDLFKVLAQEGQIGFDARLATLLYAAISADTGCFRYSNVTPETHMRAAELMSFDIDTAVINHRLFQTKSMELLRAEGAGISNLQLYADGRVAVVTFPYALKVALGLGDEHLDTLVDIARSVEGAKIAIAIRQSTTEGIYRVSVRSSCDYDVSTLCAAFNGGGHKKAAGCTLSAPDMESAVDQLLAVIDFLEL